MSELAIAILTLCGLGIWAFSEMLKKRRLRHLPDVSDDDFLEIFAGRFPDMPDVTVIHERRHIAGLIGMPVRKLSPDHAFEELSEYLNFLGSYDLAIGDLEDEISELFEDLGMEKPYHSPATVGELIYEIAKAKMISQRRAGGNEGLRR